MRERTEQENHPIIARLQSEALEAVDFLIMRQSNRIIDTVGLTVNDLRRVIIRHLEVILIEEAEKAKARS